MIVSTGDLTPKLLEEVVRQEICGQPQDRETEASTVGERSQLTDHSQPLAVGWHSPFTHCHHDIIIYSSAGGHEEGEREGGEEEERV